WPVKTNATFIGTALVHPDFMASRLDTGFIEGHEDDLVYEVEPPAWLLALVAEAHVASSSAPAGFRLNAAPQTQARLADGQRVYVAALARPLTYDQRQYALAITEQGVPWTTLQGATWRFEPARHAGAATGGAHDGDILAPMPGKVIALDVAEGDQVEEGQRMMVLEAMKMEHALTAPFAGTERELAVTTGTQVEVEQQLARVEKKTY